MVEELTEEQRQELAAAEELKRQVLAEHAFCTDIMGQMQHNIERMEREGTTNAPALDSSSSGRKQYDIDKAILAQYGRQRVALEKKHKKTFEPLPMDELEAT